MAISKKQIIELIIRFLAIVFSIAINMRRVLSSDRIALDDFLFFLSVLVGIIVGITWKVKE